MSDDIPEKTEIEKLRDEFTAQLEEMRRTYQEDMAAKDKQIKDLQDHNQELGRELVRSSLVSPPAPAAPVKTDEEIYAEKVGALGSRCAEKIKELY